MPLSTNALLVGLSCILMGVANIVAINTAKLLKNMA